MQSSKMETLVILNPRGSPRQTQHLPKKRLRQSSSTDEYSSQMQIRAILALVLFVSLYTGKAVFPSVIYK